MQAAVVTGAGQRLGKSIALALATDGYAVAIHYNSSRAPAEEVVAEIVSAGGKAAAVGADLSDPTTARDVIEAAAAALGPLSLLVNSASYYDSDTLADLSLESWRKLTDVNLAAPVMLTQAFAKQFEAAKLEQGAVINMLDVQILAPSPQFFSYFCAKGGLEMATRLAAFELAPKIRVNGIAPGLVLPSWGQTAAEFADRQTLTPLGAGLGAEDIVGAVRYLARARHVTGQMIAVDSGQRLMGFGNAAVRPLET
ncbi:MAG: SDR family NAD(P)-dependent oxidoreductase [Neomegalonema sp.]|nr:SDR family NAD(P)-dependent oxidoreductase [Neomegalonema sp.]